MKSVFFILCLISASAFAEDFLTKKQTTIVLDKIDSVCGDTWCEGDFGFRFDKFSCDKKTKSCELEFDIARWYDEEEGETPTPYQSFTCTIKGVSTFSHLIKENGNYHTLQSEFYDTVTNCVHQAQADYEF